MDTVCTPGNNPLKINELEFVKMLSTPSNNISHCVALPVSVHDIATVSVERLVVNISTGLGHVICE